MMNTLARLALSAILCVFLVGFGVCGATGIVIGVSKEVSELVPLGLVGIGIAWICWAAIAQLWRKPPPPGGE